MPIKKPQLQPQTQQQTQPQTQPPAQPQASTEVDIVKQQIVGLQSALQEKDAAHKRALADYINLQRRTQQDQERFVKLATSDFLERLLVPIDHLEMVADHLKDPTLMTVLKQLQQTLQIEGLREIVSIGKPFDPHTMEAGDAVSGEKDKVVKVRRKGYLLNGVVFRPALVEVGNGNKE